MASSAGSTTGLPALRLIQGSCGAAATVCLMSRMMVRTPVSRDMRTPCAESVVFIGRGVSVVVERQHTKRPADREPRPPAPAGAPPEFVALRSAANI